MPPEDFYAYRFRAAEKGHRIALLRRMNIRGGSMNFEPTVDENERRAPASSLGRGSQVVRFADFEFDFERDQLRRNGVSIALSPKPDALLRYLLANPQRVVSKTELMQSLWGGVVVTDDSLVQCVRELRSRLGELGPELITTHPRRGYMFDVDVRPCASGEPDHAALNLAESPPPATTPASVSRHALRRRWRTLALAAALGAVAIAGSAIYMRPATAPYRIDEEIAKRYSLVVTPFRDVGSTPAPMAVRDGLTDEIAARLAERQTAVVTRSTTPVGASYAVSGSTSARGAGVGIDIQVKSVPEGEVVWSEHYDYPDANDPGINLDAALRVTSGLRLRFSERHRAKVSVPGYHFDPADLALSGWDDIDHRQNRKDVARGKARFEEALKADPESVTALTGLGAALMSERFGYSGDPMPRDISESERVAAKALSIAPNSSVALINWGNVLLFRGEPAVALPFYERAVLRAPSNPNAHLRYANVLLLNGRMDEVQPQIDAALRIGHRDAQIVSRAYALASDAAFVSGQHERAYALAQRAIAEGPTLGSPYSNLASIDALEGRPERAAKNMSEHRRLMPFNTVHRYVVNNPSGSDTYLEGRNRMIDGLRAAGLPER